MKHQKTYSLQQLAKATGIPDSTVRYYQKNYSEYFPRTRVEGSKHPVYEAECIGVLELIREALESGKSKHDVLQSLGEKYTPIYEDESDTVANRQHSKQQTSNNEIATTNQQPPNFMQTIKQLVDFSDNQAQLTEHYQIQNEQQRKLIEELQRKNSELTARLSDAEAELKQNKKPSFLKRIVG
jgi:DNA-binding transcriptional MerR regulator